MSVRPDDLLDNIDMSKAPPPNPKMLQERAKRSDTDYEELQGPIVPAGLGGELERDDHVATSPGFPLPVSSQYDDTHGTDTTPHDQGVVETPKLGPEVIPPWYRFGLRKRYQSEQMNKIPTDWTSQHGIVCPQDVNTPVQILGRNPRRREFTISNTGLNPLLIGKSPDDAMQNGFTINAGGSYSDQHQASVFAYVAGSGTDSQTLVTTTVDVIETFYDPGMN